MHVEPLAVRVELELLEQAHVDVEILVSHGSSSP